MGNQIRRALIASGIWLAAVIAATAFVWLHNLNSAGFTSENDVARAENEFYVTDNGRAEGIVWQLDNDGDIVGTFSTSKLAYLQDYRASKVSVINDEACVIFSKKHNDNGRTVTEYAVVRFNDELQPTYISAPFRFDLELNLSGFVATEDTIYMTAINDTRNMVYVYEIGQSDLGDISTTKLSDDDVTAWEKLSAKLNSKQDQNSESGRYFAEAQYDGADLFVRMDNEAPSDPFVLDTEAANLFNQRSMSLSQSRMVVGVSMPIVLVIFGLGVALIFFLSLMLYGRTRLVYVIALTEVALFVGISAFFIYHLVANRSVIEKEYIRYATESIEDVFDGYSLLDLSNVTIYDSSDYTVIASRLQRKIEDVTTSDGAPTIVGTAILDADGNIIFSDDGCNFESVSARYGGNLPSLVTTAVGNSQAQTKVMMVGGESTLFLAVPLADAGYNGYAGLVAAVYDDTISYMIRENMRVLIPLLVLFAIASAILITLATLQSRDITALQEALGRLADEEEDIEKPAVIGRDMNFIWNSIFEIQKNFSQSNRIKLLTYEAYYRFAPKSIERILDLPSIMEVQGGDAVERHGTIAFITSIKRGEVGRPSISKRQNLLTELEAMRKKHDGIFVSNDNSLSQFKMLFLEDNENTVDYGLDTIGKVRETGKGPRIAVTIVLHYTPFVYGVLGTDEQASVYLSSPKSDEMERYVRWLRGMSLGLVLTETVMEHENVTAITRLIGFIILDEKHPEKRLNLYEVLDAEYASTAKKRIETKDKFDEALSMFYKQDFYFSRNAFSEILRVAPDDEMAKWYLFECERYLNDATPEDFIGALHME